MRIAIVTPLFPNASDPVRGIFIYRTAARLQSLADLKIYCLLANYPGQPPIKPFVADESVQSIVTAPVQHIAYQAIPVISRPINSFLAARVLEPVLAADRPDVILAYWLYPEGYAALCCGERLGIPVVVGARGTDLRKIGSGGA